MSTTKSLNDQIEFDCPFRITEDGKVAAKPEGVYAPTLLDEKLDDPRWQMITGYSGQDRYSGPIMHNSEYVGGALEQHILSNPGVYVIVAAYWTPADDDQEKDLDVEGWAVCKLNEED